MTTHPFSLFINGAFKDTLAEIEKHPGSPCYLQPYSTGRIKNFAKSPPTPESPVALYLSLTDSLNTASYRANVIGWQDKRELAKDKAALESAQSRIKEFQPSEKEGIYLEDKGKEYVNLITVIDVQPLESPFPVSRLIKTSNGKPLEKKTRAGGWSYVRQAPKWLGMITEALNDDVESELQTAVATSLADSAAARQQRLATAPRLPETVQVVSRAFRRNPDVIAEVLVRAEGTCEECRSPAPFRRAKDSAPYLEVHHRIMLSVGGEDTVENALALCPNCHRKLHFGKSDAPGQSPRLRERGC